MKYLKIFETKTSFIETKDSLEEPWVCSTDDDEKVYVNECKPTPKSRNVVVRLNIPSNAPDSIPMGGGDYWYIDDVWSEEWEMYFYPSEKCDDIILDGVSIGPVDWYNVSKGMHTIEYVMKDKTQIFTDQFCCFDALGIMYVSIPDTVKTIGSNGFYGCKTLQKVDMSKSVEVIDDLAFTGCPFTTIDLPKTLTYIGDMTFWDTGLTSVTYKGTIEEWNMIPKDGNEDRNNCVVHCIDGDTMFIYE